MIGLLLVACSTTPGASSNIGVGIGGVNYSDKPITYALSDPDNPASVGGEPVNAFAAGGLVCCFSLPKTWRPGIKVRVQIFDTHRKEVKEEVVDLPPYIDGRPGQLWAVHYQDGSVEVLSSEYGPPNAKWPGRIKGWPSPTVEYRRKRWERDLEFLKQDVSDTQTLLRELRDSPEKSLKERWEFDKEREKHDIARFSGPNDPAYKEYLVKQYEETLQSRKQRLDEWMKRRP